MPINKHEHNVQNTLVNQGPGQKIEIGHKGMGAKKKRERFKGRDLNQSYDKSPYNAKNPKNTVTAQKHHQKLRLHNDRGQLG